MVDLGFLLITFFMLTTSLVQQNTMEATFPEGEGGVVDDSRAMTIILGDADSVYYYFGMEAENIKSTSYNKDGIQKILLAEAKKRNPAMDSIRILNSQFRNKIIDETAYRARISAIKSRKGGLVVLIKPTEKSRYQNLIDILDEMNLCAIGSYTIAELTTDEANITGN